MIREKWLSAHRRYHNEGAKSVLLLYPRRLRAWIRTFSKFWGRTVELKGNIVEIEGLEFSVAVPGLPAVEKARFLFDRYERPERITIREFLDPKVPVVEFGANIGVVSCIVNKKLQSPEQHIVVEANPTLIPLLKQNRERNQCHFEITACAVAYGVDQVSFNLDEHILGSSLLVGTRKSAIVPATTLARILDEHDLPLCTLICDIEGSEVELISNEAGVIRDRVSAFFVEVHPKIRGQQAIDEAVQTLIDLGFEKKFDRWSNMVFVNSALSANSRGHKAKTAGLTR